MQPDGVGGSLQRPPELPGLVPPSSEEQLSREGRPGLRCPGLPPAIQGLDLKRSLTHLFGQPDVDIWRHLEPPLQVIGI